MTPERARELAAVLRASVEPLILASSNVPEAIRPLWPVVARRVLEIMSGALESGPEAARGVAGALAELSASGAHSMDLLWPLEDLAVAAGQQLVEAGASGTEVASFYGAIRPVVAAGLAVLCEISERQQRELLDTLGNMKVAVFRAAPDSTLLALNQAGAEILGAQRPEELIGQPFAENYLDDGERAKVRGLALSHGKALGARFRARRRDGQTVWLETNMVGRFSPEGELEGFEGFGREVTELVAAEEEVRKLDQRLREQEQRHIAELEAQVSQRTAELERANRELQMLDGMKDAFLANVSHELRTPLVSGLGYVDLILSGGLGQVSERVRKGLRISAQNLRRLVGLIDDLLAFTQRGHFRDRLSLSVFALEPLVQACVAEVRPTMHPRGRVQIAVPRELQVQADQELLRRVFFNLLSNADKFSGDEAEILIDARALDAERAEVRVMDNGIGIPPAERELVFNRLYRSSATDPAVYRGTGIGLSLVREILELHQCTIRAEGRDGSGTSIVFTLPLAPSAPAQDD